MITMVTMLKTGTNCKLLWI